MHTTVGLKRENHFLPVCYQKGFADSTGRVWVKFAGDAQPEHKHPRSVGKKTNFYVRTMNGFEDDKIEDFFNKSVENDFAILSQRVKREQNRLSNLTVREQKALLSFVASQAVRIPANKGCMEEQSGHQLRTNEFLFEMGKQLRAIIGSWIGDPPSFEFYTSLPFVEDRFITGDDPVVLEIAKENSVWTPTDNARIAVSPIQEILEARGALFTVALSPYVCVSLRPHQGGETTLPPRTMEPSAVRRFNAKIRGQCQLFTLARDEASLA